MESQRSFLFIALMVVSFLLYQQWQQDNAPEPITQFSQSDNDSAITQSSDDDFVPAPSASKSTEATTKASATLVEITTDVLAIKIDTKGGDIVEATLLDYDTEQGNGIPFTMMQNGDFRYIAQSGLTGAQGIDRTVKGRPIYQVENTTYQMTEGQPLVVSLTYITNDGLTVKKNFSFTLGSYQVDVDYIVENASNSAASVELYAQLRQSASVDQSSALIPTYRGAAYSTKEERYEKYDFDDIADAKLNETTQGGWVAMLQHYFVSAWVPNAEQVNLLYTEFSRSKNEAVIGFKAPAQIIEPGSTETISTTFYVGPKDQDALAEIADGLDLTVDFGFLFMISSPLHWLLIQIQALVINWGVAIIIITVIVKGIMYPLTKAQYTSMAKMRELQPKMTQLKERFGDDRQKLSQAMMELYRKEKVNPAGGCLPLLIQMPIFLALYWVFLESVELRHASFGLWLTDLSSKDPYYILPVLMGISMFIMQKMQPMTIQDPMQQKIMQYMPVMFTIFFFWFPSGLVLYWLVSNVISIIQMKIIFASLEKQKNK
ncbi:membrane protein insertase YidC [Thalassotalea sp. 1_MG-2023]|uniref:membrane protein insertase YidC n=1 Tax=Thalassotalea sp. 1_MG-2023 TaxID=3062680 RepID=UPI0026E25E85|nr:membrane protein insertase YidC [Thalassotalea sp. 1_MG-2023]MDO6427644.1 membrane protein insertase YidC [Thalassotalea sp. 1_MG-2023]